MGLFGGDSSSSQTTNVKTANVGADNGAIAASEGSSVNVLDAGAIKNSLDFAGNANAKNLEFAAASLDFSTEGINNAFDFSTASAKQFSEASASALDTAFQFAKESLGLVKNTVEATQKTSDSAINSALNQVDSANSGGAQRLLYLAGAALVVLAFIAWKGH